jgi:hypothetical protein
MLNLIKYLIVLFGLVIGLASQQEVQADDFVTLTNAYAAAGVEIEDLLEEYGDDESVGNVLSTANHQLDGHAEQLQNGLLTVDQGAYQYVIDYVYLIHELRTLPLFAQNESDWAAKFSEIETSLLTNMHNFQAIGDPFSLSAVVNMADFSTIRLALTKEAVVKASATELEWRVEQSAIDMRPTWEALIMASAGLVVIGFFEMQTMFFSRRLKLLKRRFRF